MHPLGLRAWLFDLDGVLTDTARLHAEAWRVTFNEVLGDRRPPFDADADYLRYVDGKARADGVCSFLNARGITLPEGARSDAPGTATVWAVCNAKNERFLELLAEQGAEVFPDAIRFARVLRDSGRHTAVVSASENCRAILERTGLGGLFSVVVDGQVAASQGLEGKPAPDTFLFAAEALDVAPSLSAVVEDAPAGVAAARSGGFAFVVGVARRAPRLMLLDAGADVSVSDLGELDELTRLLERSLGRAGSVSASEWRSRR